MHKIINKSFAVIGKNQENVSKLKNEIINFGFCINQIKPDFVISLGGDGTYLYSERKFPSIPKILMRDSSICKKCTETRLIRVLYAISQQKYKIDECIKLEASVKSKNKNYKFFCANDFIIRNKKITDAMRFSVSIGKKVFSDLIGDGIVVSTPFGSTAYFYSITGKKFRKGIGIAFNNTTQRVPPIKVSQNSQIKIKIERDKAEFASDNNPNMLTLEPGDIVEIKKSSSSAKIVTIRLGVKDTIKRLMKGRRRSLF